MLVDSFFSDWGKAKKRKLKRESSRIFEMHATPSLKGQLNQAPEKEEESEEKLFVKQDCFEMLKGFGFGKPFLNMTIKFYS